MQANYLKLQFDKPETIALKYPTPREVSGAWGPQLLWILADGRAFYTTPEYREQVGRFKPGERFTVAKRKQGNKTVLEVGQATSPKAEQPAIRILSRADSLDAPVVDLPRTQLAASLREAVSAADQAEKFAQQIGYNLRFTAGDIRSMAISVLIGMQGKRAA
jgi:hypothetical protein